MKLWLLTRVKGAATWREPLYDAFDGHAIRAATEDRARELANQKAADEGRIWLDPEKTLCRELTVDGPEGIVLSDFNAG